MPESQDIRKAESETIPVLAEWAPADGSVPKGLFLAAVRYRGADGVRLKTLVLEGQLNRAYDPRTGRRMKFAEGSALTHYMPLPPPPGANHLQ
ncbi:hypothetical protein MKJ04_11485 [Pontibacter sp. E15-1]|uniref:hypothetical protein n=1 Tax=Pontibacter sp. E15-1 TaxID=2919918 RepID=UPI001F50103A|nr:hypothetical protein [Pontibacter sp. E15-1]MCJ8165466.1 hypothetical protein [Pontibacter sp. E15-1]